MASIDNMNANTKTEDILITMSFLKTEEYIAIK